MGNEEKKDKDTLSNNEHIIEIPVTIPIRIGCKVGNENKEICSSNNKENMNLPHNRTERLLIRFEQLRKLNKDQDDITKVDKPYSISYVGQNITSILPISYWENFIKEVVKKNNIQIRQIINKEFQEELQKGKTKEEIEKEGFLGVVSTIEEFNKRLRDDANTDLLELTEKQIERIKEDLNDPKLFQSQEDEKRELGSITREMWQKKLEDLEKQQLPGIKKWYAEHENLINQLEMIIIKKQTESSRAIPGRVRREVWRRDEGKCVKCGSRERLELDHIIPFSKGGSNTARNIELLCEKCNREKRDNI